MADGKQHWWWQRPFLFVGRMAGDKGVTHILGAWLALRDRLGDDCPPLWLAGGTPEDIEAARACLGWPKGPTDEERDGRLVWWGYMDPAAISALLSRVAVVVMHSRYEPGGRVVLEAMAQGVPVIATPFGFAADLVRDWQTGFLVAFGDQDRLTARMAHFARQPLLRHVLGADARRVARAALRQWDFMGSHEAVYEQAVAGVVSPAAPKRPDADAPPGVQFRRREVPPVYPLEDREPTDEAVRSLVETTTGQPVTTLAAVASGPGSSRLWRATSAGETWIIKWPYPRLSRHVLWSDTPPRDLLTPGRDRFERECHAGTLPGFVPWDGIDPDRRLMMRRQRPRLAHLDADTVALVAAAFRKLGATPFKDGAMAALLAQDWRRASWSEVLEGHRAIVTRLGDAPWDRGRLFSARMAWRLLELDMERGRLSVGLPLPSDARDGIALFRDLAASEETLPVTVAHGSGDVAHCLWMADGDLGLIDGEHIHPALAGEDTAALIHCAVTDGVAHPAGAAAWPTLLEAATRDQDEWARVLSWLGYLAMEAVFKNAVLINPKAHAMALRHLDELTRLARSRLTR